VVVGLAAVVVGLALDDDVAVVLALHLAPPRCVRAALGIGVGWWKLYCDLNHGAEPANRRRTMDGLSIGAIIAVPFSRADVEM
jgi:hypothetical protein